MENFTELQELLKNIKSSESVLSQIQKSEFSKHNGLEQISKLYRFENEDDFETIKQLVLDIQTMRLENLKSELSLFSINKSEPKVVDEKAEFERLSKKFANS